jgi:hypothetical protein
MGRHPDITDAEIAMDFSKHNIANENLKKLLTENKIIKTKSGHYVTTATKPEDPAKPADPNKNGSSIVDPKGSSSIVGGAFKMPKKETPLTVEPEPSNTAENIVTIGINA